MSVIKRVHPLVALLIALLAASGCTTVPISPHGTPSALDPRGPVAAHLTSLTWFMLALGAVMWLLVIAFLSAALLRRRRGDSNADPDSRGGDEGRRWPIWGGIVMPAVVLVLVFGYNLYTLTAIEKPREKTEVNIEIVGRRWWWEVRYPDQGVTTANEIHIPVGMPIRVKLQSADVIHSFWIPQLYGKMDLVPTRTNFITLQADAPGVYRGQCAEFCGLQHAHMGFLVVAESQADFEHWAKAQAQSAAAPTDQAALEGQEVFLSSGCVFCHTVRGLDDKQIDRSSVDLGPDLTHLSSRLAIAGASLDNNRGNLAGWIVDAQHVKPGSLMPNMQLNSEDLQSLLVYLEGLR